MSRKPRSQSVTGELPSSIRYRRNSIIANCSFKATCLLYREIKQSLTDLDKMFTLMEREREIADLPGRTSSR